MKDLFPLKPAKFRLKSNYLAFLLIACVVSCKAQTNPVQLHPASGTKQAILPKDADPQTMFRCSMKDQDGNLWFGTVGAGVYRYDGKLFTHLTSENGIGNPIIYSIAEGNDGTVWIGTQDGVFCGKGDHFKRFNIEGMPDSFNSFPAYTDILQNQSSQPAKKPQAVFCIIQDQAGNTWFGTEFDGLFCYDGKSTRNFRFFEHTWMDVSDPEAKQAALAPNQLIQFILESKDGSIWFSSVGNENMGVFHYNGKGFKKQATAHVFHMIQDRSDNIWMATRDSGVYCYNGKTIRSFTRETGFCDRGANALMEDKNGTIWITTVGNRSTSGGCIARFKDGEIKIIPSGDMENNRIWTILEDTNGFIWFGTKDFGLYQYDPQTAKFSKFSAKEN